VLEGGRALLSTLGRILLDHISSGQQRQEMIIKNVAAVVCRLHHRWYDICRVPTNERDMADNLARDYAFFVLLLSMPRSPHFAGMSDCPVQSLSLVRIHTQKTRNRKRKRKTNKQKNDSPAGSADARRRYLTMKQIRSQYWRFLA
jgi:hypothetical protein